MNKKNVCRKRSVRRFKVFIYSLGTTKTPLLQQNYSSKRSTLTAVLVLFTREFPRCVQNYPADNTFDLPKQ